MRTVSVAVVLHIHESLLQRHGGASGLRDEGALIAALAQPTATFDGADLYPTTPDKIAALAHAVISNHPFVDGNKRVGHTLLELLLRMNSYQLSASDSEREALILATAAGDVTRDEFRGWVATRVSAAGST